MGNPFNSRMSLERILALDRGTLKSKPLTAAESPSNKELLGKTFESHPAGALIRRMSYLSEAHALPPELGASIAKLIAAASRRQRDLSIGSMRTIRKKDRAGLHDPIIAALDKVHSHFLKMSDAEQARIVNEVNRISAQTRERYRRK
ncbi:MAG: hypothetical protein ABIG96_06685 [Candidatus Micrarchaeota archaeon]